MASRFKQHPLYTNYYIAKTGDYYFIRADRF